MSRSRERFCKRGHDTEQEGARYPSGTCKACRQTSSSAYYEANRDKVLESGRVRYATDPEKKKLALAARKAADTEAFNKKARERLAKWKRDNPEKYKASVKRKYIQRRADPAKRLLDSLRARVCESLKRGETKSASTLELLGCSIPELRERLEQQFRPGMSWDNYGPVWHVDHIKPCALFDFDDPAQQRACFHWSNLQPLFALENISKGAKYIEVTENG
jgi:hypothetical protein